jgi:stalled ribosome rescue protein Dom34
MPRRRRGYPLAALIGLTPGHAALWDVFSESVKPGPTVDEASKYALHEGIVNHLRPRFSEGVKTVLVAAEDKSVYDDFMAHIRKHHSWLLKGWELNTVTFIRLEEPATNSEEVRRLVSNPTFKSRLSEASEGDLDKVMGALEKRLGSPEGIDTVVFSLDDAEAAVYGETPPEYLLMVEGFQRKHVRRTMRLLQVAQNRGVKTRIIPSGSSHAVRLSQFGGLVCMLKDEAD